MKAKRALATLAVLSLSLFVFPALQQGTKIKAHATLAGHKLDLQLAKSEAEREKGLGGQSELPRNQGMLFVFDTPGQTCFWMKDMKFSLDILWFNSNHKLIYQKTSISPDTYPASFCPPAPAKYVLELDAGNSVAWHIKTGDQLTLENQ